MSSLSAEVLKGELRERIAKFGHLLDQLEEIYPAPVSAPAVEGATVHPGNGHKRTAKPHPGKSSTRGGRFKTERSGDGKSKVCHGPCGLLLTLDQYPLSKICSDGHTGTCKKCTQDRHRRNSEERKKAARKKVSAPAASAPATDKPYSCNACGKGFRTLFVKQEHEAKCGVA